MLQLWLDDSGKGQPPAFVLAGFFGAAESWRDLSGAWKALLHRPPRLQRLKAYEAFGLRGEFKGWTEAERDRRLLDFVPLIKCAGKGIAFVIEQTAFEAIVKSAHETPFRSPQTLAYFLSLVSILPMVQESFGRSERIDMIFDRNLVRLKNAETAYNELFARAPDLASLLARKRPRFEDDEHCMPLQAADLLAHCVRADYDPSPKYERVRRSPVFAKLQEIPTALVPIEAPLMQYWRDRVEVGIPRQVGLIKARPWHAVPSNQRRPG